MHIVAGTIETIGGRQVGRVQLALREQDGRPAGDELVAAVTAELTAAGIVAREVDA